MVATHDVFLRVYNPSCKQDWMMVAKHDVFLRVYNPSCKQDWMMVATHGVRSAGLGNKN